MGKVAEHSMPDLDIRNQLRALDSEDLTTVLSHMLGDRGKDGPECSPCANIADTASSKAKSPGQ